MIIFYLKSHVPLHWINMVLVLVVFVNSMEQLVNFNFGSNFHMNRIGGYAPRFSQGKHFSFDGYFFFIFPPYQKFSLTVRTE